MIVGSQTIIQCGEAATISNVVISLGDLGFEGESPGGGVTTIPMPMGVVVKATDRTPDAITASTDGRSRSLQGAMPSISATI